MASLPDETFQRALAEFRAGRVEDAERSFKDVLNKNPRHVGALNLLGILLMSLQKFEEAERYFQRALAENPGSEITLYNYGLVLKVLGRTAEALERLTQALAINDTVADTWNNRGTVLKDLGRHQEACADFDRAIALMPTHAAAFCNKGNALSELGSLEDSLHAYDRALALEPRMAEAWVGRGAVLRLLDRSEEAITAYERACALNPSLAGAWIDLGHQLIANNRSADAGAAFDRALALNSGLAEAWLGRGHVHFWNQSYDEAAAAYDKALALKPMLPEAWVARGSIHHAYRRYAEALADIDKALMLNDKFAVPWHWRGIVLGDLGRLEEAAVAVDRALALKANFAEAWVSRGNIAFTAGRHRDAFEAYDKAFALNPFLRDVEGHRIYAKLRLCDWTNLDAEAAHLFATIAAKKAVNHPMPLLLLGASAVDQLACARQNFENRLKFPAICGGSYSHDRIRVAYLSSDYRVHAIAYLISEVLELHDRTKFEVVGISFGPDDGSDMRARIVKSFDQFHDIRNQSDRDAAELIRRLEIDIAVDLNNYSEMARPGILAHRPAPIQASYLGVPSTMGADFIDYAIVDKFVVSDDQQKYWTEKFVYMPDSYLVHDTRSKREMPALPPTRTQAGLPDKAFVFCCFNNPFKITPPIFQTWMRLLKAVEGSVAWFSSAGEATRANLRHEAERAGVDPGRLIFAPLLNRIEDHLSRHRVADLFLDTLPYNAHTTAADALWAGLPLVTCAGNTFAARVAGSLLHAIGLPELVTENLQDYEFLALQLARDPARLADTKARLIRNRNTYPLFDTARFTRHLEAAYMSMVERHRRGESPAPFAVDPVDHAVVTGAS